MLEFKWNKSKLSTNDVIGSASNIKNLYVELALFCNDKNHQKTDDCYFWWSIQKISHYKLAIVDYHSCSTIIVKYVIRLVRYVYQKSERKLLFTFVHNHLSAEFSHDKKKTLPFLSSFTIYDYWPCIILWCDCHRRC